MIYDQLPDKRTRDPNNEKDDNLVSNEHILPTLIKAMHITERKTAQGEDEFARKFLSLMLDPLLVISDFKFADYLKTFNKKFFNYLEREDKRFSGQADVICLTQKHGIFVGELKKTETTSKLLEKDIGKSWYQTLKSRLILKCINSDLNLQDANIHQITCFPYLPLSALKQHLCDIHIKCCVTKEVWEQNEAFSNWLNHYLNCKQSNTELHEDTFRRVGERLILLSTTIREETELSSNAIRKKISSQMQEILDAKYLTPMQKALYDGFSFEKGQENYLKVAINGHFGTGKSFMLLLAIQKLVQMIDKQTIDNEKHAIIFTSISHSGYVAYSGVNNTKAFLKDVKGYLNKVIKSTKITKFLVREWHELQKELGMDRPLSVLEPKIIPSLLNKCKEKYLGQHQNLNNVHLFIDEVTSYGGDNDWTPVEEVARKNNNVIWFGMKGDELNRNEGILKDKLSSNFQVVNLCHIMRCTKRITEFLNETTTFLSHSSKLLRADCKPLEFYRTYYETNVKSQNASSLSSGLEVGHCVDGKTPRLIIVPTCDCKNPFSAYIQKKVENFIQQQHDGSGNDNETESLIFDHIMCQCLKDNLEKAFKTSLCELFGLKNSLTLKEVVNQMDSTVDIIQSSPDGKVLSHPAFKSLRNILKEQQISFEVMDEETNGNGKRLSHKTSTTKITFHDSRDVTGREFDNVVYITGDWRYHYLPTLKDISNSHIFKGCSRAKSQLHIITLGGNDEARLDYNNPFELNDVNILEDILKDPVYPRNISYGWLRFSIEILRRFLLPYLIRKQKLLLLPLHDDKNHPQFKDNNEAIETLQKGTNLVEILDAYVREGNDLFQKGSLIDALEAFWKGLMCLGGRMGNCLDGDNIKSCLNPVDNDEVLDYLNDIKSKELELLNKILECLTTLGKEEEAFVTKQLLTKYFPGDDAVKALKSADFGHNEGEDGNASEKKKDQNKLRQKLSNGIITIINNQEKKYPVFNEDFLLYAQWKFRYHKEADISKGNDIVGPDQRTLDENKRENEYQIKKHKDLFNEYWRYIRDIYFL